eukprot:2991575-Prymnesium_polylepis.1
MSVVAFSWDRGGSKPTISPSRRPVCVCVNNLLGVVTGYEDAAHEPNMARVRDARTTRAGSHAE